MYFKARRVPKLGDSLKRTMERKFLWKAIDAGMVGQTYKELSEEIKELKGSRMVSWKENTLRIKVGSPVQRQEINMKKEKIIEAFRKKSILVREIKTVF